MIQSLLRRWRYWRNRDAEAEELEAELDFHREQAGAPMPRAAIHREDARAAWIPLFLDDLAHDIRHALRGLRQSPSFALTAIGSLALALGFGTAIASLARAVLVKPLPFAHGDRLVLIFEGRTNQTDPHGDTSPATYRDLARTMKTLQGVALFGSLETNLSGGQEPERVDGAFVTPNFFDTVGVRPHLGRFFHEAEGEPGSDQVTVLSYELWQRRYGGDRSILGREIRMNDRPFKVIGILPPGFRYCFQRPELWRTFAVPPARWATRGSRYIWVTGRLAPGATVAQVNSELERLSAQLRRDHPRESPHLLLKAMSLRARLTEDARTSLFFLLAAVAALLLIACSNVANLLLTRSVSRGAEFEVRRALGAGAWRIARQLLTESLVIAAGAAIVAVPVTAGAFVILQSLVPGAMAAYTRLSVDWTTAALLGSLALGAALISGLLPAVRGAQPINTRAVNERSHGRWRGALITAELALAILLLNGASLLFRTFINLQNVDPGFEPQPLISAQTWLPDELMKDPPRRTQFYRSVLDRVRAIPGVTHATYATTIPTAWKGGISSFHVEGRVYEPGVTMAMMRQVSGDYFTTLGIRLRAGRLLDENDTATSEKVVVINAALAQQIWPGENPLGKRIRRGDPQTPGEWIRVVGVVDNVREMGLSEPAPVITYFPESQHPAATFSAPLYVVARGPASATAELRRAIQAVNPRQTVSKLLPVSAVLEDEYSARRVRTLISSAFALLALLLACFGLYGVLSYSVASRSRELGVRIALGASAGNIVRLVLSEGLRLSVLGIALGVASALALTRFMKSLLFQVQPDDPLLLLAGAGILLLAALFACWRPALRAFRIDPALALRGD